MCLHAARRIGLTNGVYFGEGTRSTRTSQSSFLTVFPASRTYDLNRRCWQVKFASVAPPRMLVGTTNSWILAHTRMFTHHHNTAEITFLHCKNYTRSYFHIKGTPCYPSSVAGTALGRFTTCESNVQERGRRNTKVGKLLWLLAAADNLHFTGTHAL
jgi:hypothetical protein